MSELDYLDALSGLQSFLNLRVDFDGGYPAAINDTSIDGYIVVADVDSEKPFTRVYKRERLMTLYDTYCRFMNGTFDETPASYPFAQWLFDTNALKEIEE